MLSGNSEPEADDDSIAIGIRNDITPKTSAESSGTILTKNIPLVGHREIENPISLDQRNVMLWSNENLNTVPSLAATDYKGAKSIAYSFDPLSSNSMKSSNPHSGCRETELARTLDTTIPEPSKNQGGIAIAVHEVSPTITAKMQGSTGWAPYNETEHLVPVIALAENTIDRKPENGGNGDGYTEGGPMYTLNTVGVHAVAAVDWRTAQVDIEKTQTLKTDLSHGSGPCIAVDVYNYSANEETTQTIRAANTNEHVGTVLVPTVVLAGEHPQKGVDIEISPTLPAAMGMGGGHTPLVTSPIILDRSSFNQGPNAKYEPLIEEGETMPTLIARGPHAVAISSGAMGNETVGALCARDFKGVGNQYINEGKLISQEIGEPIDKGPQGSSMPVHAFKVRSGCDGGGKGYLGEDERSFTLSTVQDQQIAHPITPPQVFDWQSGGDARGLDLKETAQLQRCQTPALMHAVAPTLTATNDPSRSPQSSEVTNQVQAVHSCTMAIRRLTPIECERLQGFPDNWTKIPFRNKSEDVCPDGPRYKACGNSMAVPVMRWIGQRIAMVSDLMDELNIETDDTGSQASD